MIYDLLSVVNIWRPQSIVNSKGIIWNFFILDERQLLIIIILKFISKNVESCLILHVRITGIIFHFLNIRNKIVAYFILVFRTYLLFRELILLIEQMIIECVVNHTIFLWSLEKMMNFLISKVLNIFNTLPF